MLSWSRRSKRDLDLALQRRRERVVLFIDNPKMVREWLEAHRADHEVLPAGSRPPVEARASSRACTAPSSQIEKICEVATWPRNTSKRHARLRRNGRSLSRAQRLENREVDEDQQRQHEDRRGLLVSAKTTIPAATITRRRDARRHPHAQPAARRGARRSLPRERGAGAGDPGPRRGRRLLGGSALDVIDVPLESLGAQLLFTLGVSLILFYGGLNLSLPVLSRVWIGLGLLVVPGVVLTTVVIGDRGVCGVRHLVDGGAVDGRGARADRPGDPDPAVRALAAARQGRPDRGGRVGLQRPDRRGARPGAGGRAAQRRRLARAPGGGVRGGPRDQHGDRDGRRASASLP